MIFVILPLEGRIQNKNKVFCYDSGSPIESGMTIEKEKEL